jgi:hypothetical protein
MQLNFDWYTDRAVVGALKQKLLNREVFHGQTWSKRESRSS